MGSVKLYKCFPGILQYCQQIPWSLATSRCHQTTSFVFIVFIEWPLVAEITYCAFNSAVSPKRDFALAPTHDNLFKVEEIKTKCSCMFVSPPCPLCLWLQLTVMWQTRSHSPTVYLLHWLLKLSATWQQNEWEENCAQIDPPFVQSSSKYRPEVAEHEWSEIWEEGKRTGRESEAGQRVKLEERENDGWKMSFWRQNGGRKWRRHK